MNATNNLVNELYLKTKGDLPMGLPNDAVTLQLGAVTIAAVEECDVCREKHGAVTETVVVTVTLQYAGQIGGFTRAL